MLERRKTGLGVEDVIRTTYVCIWVLAGVSSSQQACTRCRLGSLVARRASVSSSSHPVPSQRRPRRAAPRSCRCLLILLMRTWLAKLNVGEKCRPRCIGTQATLGEDDMQGKARQPGQFGARGSTAFSQAADHGLCFMHHCLSSIPALYTTNRRQNPFVDVSRVGQSTAV